MKTNTMKAASDGLSGMDKKPAAKGKLKTREMHIRKGHAGGFIARHEVEDEDGQPQHQTHEYPLANKKQLLEHISEHMAEEGNGAGDDGGQAAEMNAENNSE